MDIHLQLIASKLNLGIMMSDVTQFYPTHLCETTLVIPLLVTIVNFQYILFLLFIR